MDKQIIYYYKRGVASYLIAKKFGVSNGYVRNLLESQGIKLRGHSVTNKISAKKRTPEENHAITKAASRANRGSTHTLRHRSKLALSRQKSPTIDPIYEQPLVDLCKKRGIEIIPQKAFNKFNVDLYLVKENVVIEIFGGGESCCMTYREFLEKSFKIYGLGSFNFPKHAFAERNFHCGRMVDGDDLEHILNFRRDTFHSYFEKTKSDVNPFLRFITILFRPIIKWVLLAQSEPYKAYRTRDKLQLNHFF